MTTIIIGAGQAGAWVARTLRQQSANAEIVLVGEEPHPPYERPPLSKDLLTGAAASPPCILSEEQARDLNIDLLLGVTVVSIDRDRQQVCLNDRRTLPYDRLVLATGGSPRLPDIGGVTLPGVHTLRCIEDALKLRERMLPGSRWLVIGGGWIGLEATAAARGAGVDTMLIEAGERLCARSVPESISSFLLQLHLDNGVDIALGGGVSLIEPNTAKAGLRVHTHKGIEEADTVVIGIGLSPNVTLAKDCGLEIDNGIVVDGTGRTSDPRIYAVGDVANQPCRWIQTPHPGRIRLESWANAQNHGLAVGRYLGGGEVSPSPVPWFWSDQYQHNIQILGIPTPGSVEVLRGSIERSRFCLFQIVDSRLQAVVSVNMPRELQIARRWMQQGLCPSIPQLENIEGRLDRLIL